MTVKTGSSWAGTFVTLDATGALATPSAGPTGKLYVDGVANSATVTITGSNPYKFSVTLPSLTAGQHVDMYITATISSIATAGIVASAQADTVLTSDVKTETAAILEDTGTTLDGLIKDVPTVAEFEARTKPAADYFDPTADTVANVTAVGTTTNLTNLPAMPADWLTAAGVKADAVTKLQANLALEATLTAIKGAGWTTESLKVIRDALTAVQADLDNPNQYKADVSALATTTHLQEVEDKVDTIDTVADEIKLKTDKIPAVPAQAGEYTAAIAAIPTTPLLAANYTAPDNASISAIKAKTDTIPASPAVAGEYTASIAAIQADLDNPNQYKADVSGLATSAALATVDANVDAILDDTGTSGVLLSTSALGSIFDDEAVVGTYTMRQLLKVFAAALAGKATGGGTTTITFRGVDDASNVIVATVDASGNRSAVTLTV